MFKKIIDRLLKKNKKILSIDETFYLHDRVNDNQLELTADQVKNIKNDTKDLRRESLSKMSNDISEFLDARVKYEMASIKYAKKFKDLLK